MASIFSEFKRRGVIRMAAAYLAVAWLLAQVLDLVTESFAAPDWVMQMALGMLALGLPFALVMAWAFKVRPESSEQEEPDADELVPRIAGGSRVLNIVTSIALVLAIGFIAWDKLGPGDEPASVNVDRSVAVLPFADLSATGGQQWFADGLTEEILNALARLPELKVTARTSSFEFRDTNIAVGSIAEKLGVAHVVEGSVRRVGEELRVTAQLIRAEDGFHLWSEVYDRQAADLLDVQRDVAEKVAAALDVLLDEDRRRSMFATGTRSFAAFEAFMRGNEAFRDAHLRDPAYEATLAEANTYFERAIELDPGYAMAAVLHADRYAHILLEGHAPIVGNATDLQPGDALIQLRHDLRFAADNAPDDISRVIAELNLVFFSPGWQHMPSLLSELEALVRDGRPLPPISLWLHEILLLNGKIELAEVFAKDLQAVDPLNSAGWVDEIEIAVWQHDLAGAAQLLQSARARFGPIRPLPEIEVTMALLQDDTEKAIKLLEQFDDTGRDIVFFPPLLAALRGDADNAIRLAAEFEAAAMRPGRSMLEVYYRLADIDRLRDTLRHIDGLPAGPSILALELIHTAGSVPFHTDSTPALRQRLAEAGIEISSVLRQF